MGRRHVTSHLARLAVMGALALAATAALAGPAPAATSAAPCWKSVVLDWAADGTVDKTYPIPCYHQAIDNLRPDLQLYSSAGDDIRRALQHAITVESEGTPPRETSSGGEPPSGTDGQPAPGDGEPATTTVAAPATDEGGSVPRPLLILGALALLLLAAGAAGIALQRRRGGRPGTP